MTDLATAYVQIVPSMRGLQGEIGKQFKPVSGVADKAGKESGSRFKASFGKVAAGIGAAFAAQKVFSFLGDSVGEAREAQKVGKITEQIIKATGGAARVTADDVGRLATRLSNKTGVDDEAIQSGANLLLTFKNVRNEVGKGAKIFDRATAAAGDLSAAGFGSIEGASKMLGKALNDPLKGISALGRAGVTFTDGQKEQIKTLVASGKTLDAQKIILKEVESQVGGTAAASATAGEKMAVAWGNFKEQIGTALLPLIDRFATFMVDRVIPAMSKFISASGRLAGPLGKVRDVIASVSAELRETFAPILERVGKFMRDNPKVVKAFAIALGVMAGAIAAVTLATTLFSIALNSTGIPLFIIGIAALVAGLVYAYQNSARFRAIVDQVGASVRRFGAFLKAEVLPVVIETAGKIKAAMIPVVTALGVFVRDTLVPTLQKLVAKFREWQPTIQAVIGFMLRLYGRVLSFYAAVAGKVLPILIRFAGFIVRNVVPAVANMIGMVVKIIAKVIQFGRTMSDAGRKVATFVSGAVRKLGNLVSSITSMPGKIGKAASGMFDGIKDAFRSALNWIIDRWNSLSFSIPGVDTKIPGVGKVGGFTLSTPDIDRFVRGTNDAPGGLARINERGGELVVLPEHSRVVPHAKTNSMLREAMGGQQSIDYDRLAAAVAWALNRMGLTLQIDKQAAGRVVLVGQNVIDERR